MKVSGGILKHCVKFVGMNNASLFYIFWGVHVLIDKFITINTNSKIEFIDYEILKLVQ